MDTKPDFIIFYHFEMKEKNLSRSTLLNCRRIYSHIGKDISSDSYNLSRKAGQVQSVTPLPRQAFTALSLFCGEMIALTPKAFTHTSAPAESQYHGMKAGPQRTEVKITNTLLKGNIGQKRQTSF